MADGTSTKAIRREPMPESMRAIANRLREGGLTVRTTGRDDSRLLKVTGGGIASCDVVVDDDYFTCEYTLRRSRGNDPANVARVVACMLGAEYTDPRQYTFLHMGVTPIGAVGREMKARGMTVRMSVIQASSNRS